VSPPGNRSFLLGMEVSDPVRQQ